MDGENNGKTVLKWMILVGKPTIFGNIHIYRSFGAYQSPNLTEGTATEDPILKVSIKTTGRLHGGYVGFFFKGRKGVGPSG